MSTTATALETKRISGEELLALGDIGPCELIGGRIVPMSPTGSEHGHIESLLGLELALFVRERALGWVIVGEVGVYTRRKPDWVRGADIAFIPKDLLPNGPPKGYLEVAPALVVEIISPNDRWQEVRQKLEEYFAIGVQRVWVVEPENRAVLVCRSSTDFDKLDESDTLAGEGALEGFALPVARLFVNLANR